MRLNSCIRLMVVVIFGSAILSMPTAALADPIPLAIFAEGSHAVGPQSTSAPCIIAGTTCQQPAGFGYTNFTQSGAISSYDEYSPTYKISDFPFLIFNVAIDVNTADDGEMLELFEVRVNGNLIYEFQSGPFNIGSLSNNGNGYADWTLRSINLSAFAPDDDVVFRAAWINATDGAESFFLISTDQRVPEPSTLLLLGISLAGLGITTRRRKK